MTHDSCHKRGRTLTGLQRRLGTLAGMAALMTMVMSGSASARARDLFGFGDVAPGTIVVRTSERRIMEWRIAASRRQPLESRLRARYDERSSLTAILDANRFAMNKFSRSRPSISLGV